jgi:hypothetical protein
MKPIVLPALLSLAALNLNAACAPVMDLDVLAWSYKAMMASHNYNFTNSIGALTEVAAPFYTTDTWKIYLDNLMSSGNYEMVKSKKMNSSVGLSRSPMLLNKTNDSWVVKMNLLKIYQSADVFTEKKQSITIEITQDDQCNLKISKVTDDKLVVPVLVKPQ